MRKKWAISLAVVMLVAGISVLCYPVVSNLINRYHGSYAIQELQEQVNSLNQEQMNQEFAAAEDYNRKLLSGGDWDETQMEEEYENILNFGNGVMGYIEISRIGIRLPIYHGVDAQTLEKGIGHMASTAFPIGGSGNHSVLTGHTGLPSAKLFTDLTEMTEGDSFEVVIGGRRTGYCVDQIKVVLPNETEDLMPVTGEDYCTLVTCTPYGVNSHRLLVRGSKTELVPVPEQTETEIQKESLNWNTVWLLLLLVPVLIVIGRAVSKRRKENG